MGKTKLHDFVLGMVIVALLAALAVPALATSGKKEMEVEYTGIHLHVDGIPITGLKGDKTPFVSGGTTYLPVRAIGEALGKVVRWDGPTHTVYISDPTAADKAAAATEGKGETPEGKKTIKVDYLDIKLVVNGKEVTPKDVNGNVVEPFAYNGTTYLPVRAVGEALGKTVRWDGETKTVHLGELPQATYLVDACKASRHNTGELYRAADYKDREEWVYRAADHKSFQHAGKWYSQGFWSGMIFELGGKYESLTFDCIYDRDDVKAVKVYLDGELAQTIEALPFSGVQTVTVPLNYAQTISIARDGSGGSCSDLKIANAILHGERTVPEKPVPPADATYLVDVCEVYYATGGHKADIYKGAEGEYWTDRFENKYTNGFDVYCETVALNGKYKTLKGTIIPHGGSRYNDNGRFACEVDGQLVYTKEFPVYSAPQPIEIPLNYGMELKLSVYGMGSFFLADAYLE